MKVLKADVAAVVGSERFLTEIKTTAHFKHPHILPLFDSGSADGVLFYVMPFIDGESLRARLKRTGRLPIADVVWILRELADALAHAHARGVIHRDVKPDNVLIADRHVYLADFGIARALSAQAPDATMTGTGIMVGTPAYMAPEQIVGGPVDHRTDIYALGALAYELLHGSPPFTGSSHEITTAHLTRSAEPVAAHRPETPVPLAALVMRCLEKKPDQRWQRTDDVLAVLDGLATSSTAISAPPVRPSKRRIASVAGVLIVAGLTAGAWYARTAMNAPAAFVIGRIVHVTSEPGLELDPAISPDGRTIAYVAGLPGRTRVYIRQISGGRMVPLTDDGLAESGAQRWPQWSPDASRLVFQAGRQQFNARSSIGAPALYQAQALGGLPRRIFSSLPGGVSMSPSWSPDATQIVFAGSTGLFTSPAEGSEAPRQLVEGSDIHSPRWSPDGSRLAYVKGGSVFTFGEESLGNVSTSAIMMLSRETGRVTQITKGEWLETNPVWMPDSRTLLFISSRGGGRDAYQVRLRADGQPEHAPARVTSGLDAHSISVSADGKLLAYASYTPSANIWSIAIPESGVSSIDAQQATFGNEKIEKLAISPDGQWLAYDSDRNGHADIWKIPLAGGTAEHPTAPAIECSSTGGRKPTSQRPRIPSGPATARRSITSRTIAIVTRRSGPCPSRAAHRGCWSASTIPHDDRCGGSLQQMGNGSISR